MIPRREHAVRAFTDAFYNCVSRGHPAIIGRTQNKISGHKLKLADWPEGCGPPVAKHKVRATVGIRLSMERSARRECAVFDGEMKTKDWFLLLQIMYFSESSNFCNSCGLNVFGLTCSNEKIEQGYTFNAFSKYFGQSADQRFGIPSNVYYMILSSRLNYLFWAGPNLLWICRPNFKMGTDSLRRLFLFEPLIRGTSCY